MHLSMLQLALVVAKCINRGWMYVSIHLQQSKDPAAAAICIIHDASYYVLCCTDSWREEINSLM